MNRFLKNLLSKIKSLFGASGFLCDRCKYDYPSACNRPERPNATKCADYRKR